MSHFDIGDSLPDCRVDRRTWLAGSATALGLTLLAPRGTAFADTANLLKDKLPPPDAARVREIKRDMIRRFVYSREDLDAWRDRKAFPFCKYDPELGYLHINRQFKEGLDGAVCTYRYDANGARHTSVYADRPCRINSYGNSFTSCEQVSDNETWQEYLAGHLGEPIRNFGIGGYSVYQAYLRMRREEQRLPAQCVIFNIFDDDHYRNLYGWQRFRFGMNRKSPHPPIPHVKADPDAGTFVECANPCPTYQSLYRLCDFEGAFALFGDDYGVEGIAVRDALREQGATGIPKNDQDDTECTRRALYATTRIVDLIDRFAAQNGRTVLYVLSYSAPRIRQFINEGKRFDAALVEFFKQRRLPYVDLMEAHATEFRTFSLGIDAYLKRYFIGHYAPGGNFFCAYAIKDKLVQLLKPAPPAFTPSTANDPVK